MKPKITVYLRGGPAETKKLDSFISAAFWIGVDHAENDLQSVKVRLPSESYDTDVSTMLEFTSLLVRRQINFSVEFFTEPPPRETAVLNPEAEPSPEVRNRAPKDGDSEFEKELDRMKDDYQKGAVSKEQYESRKDELLKKWKEKVEGKLES